MYYPIIDKLKEIVGTVRRLETTEPFIIEGTIRNPSTYSGTWEGQWNDVLDAFNNGYPVWFRVRQNFVAGKVNINVPLIICSNVQEQEQPQDAYSALAIVNSSVVSISVKSNNTFVVVQAIDS